MKCTPAQNSITTVAALQEAVKFYTQQGMTFFVLTMHVRGVFTENDTKERNVWYDDSL